MTIKNLYSKLILNSTILHILLSLYFALVLNYAFYREVLKLNHLQEGVGNYFLLTIPIFLFLLLVILFQIIALPYIHKILIPIILIISAAMSYSEIMLGIYFNTNMLENVLQTTAAESLRMLTWQYLAWIFFLGVLPAILYIMVKVKYRIWWQEILWRLATVLCSLLVIFGIAKFFYQDYASFFRNNKSVHHLIIPSNFINSIINEGVRIHNANLPFVHIGLDAKQKKIDDYRHVGVIVVGETTRAQNWGLNGYQRQTTPQLAARNDIINFDHVKSCGTATAVSVPCMFSHFKHEEYNEAIAKHTDNLLDILKRAGIDAIWFDNDGGCKGVCEHIENYDATKLNLPQYCKDGECQDDILLKNIDEILDSTSKNIVIILHTIGNHGPTYYERYPPQFRKYTPTCDTNEIQKCNKQQLVNTYDNAILYIDDFLNKVIEKLNKRNNLKSSLVYISDHGESLGENGLYLHATPYGIAPPQQTHVPMIMWLSKIWLKNENVNFSCLKHNAMNNSYSQDNLFHTVLSMMDIDPSLSVYDKKLDILAACKK